jgi:hypothetical protein
MTPAELLAHLRGLGFKVAAQGDKLTVTGKSARLTPDLAALIAAHKQPLLDLLWFEVPLYDAPWLRRWGEEYDDRPPAQEESPS